MNIFYYKIRLSFFLLCVNTFCSQAQLLPYFKAGKWGFADSSAKLVTKCEYDFASPFHEGIAIIKKNNLFGYVNERGKIIGEIIYGQADNYNGGIARVLVKNDFCYIDKNGKDVSPWKKKH